MSDYNRVRYPSTKNRAGSRYTLGRTVIGSVGACYLSVFGHRPPTISSSSILTGWDHLLTYSAKGKKVSGPPGMLTRTSVSAIRLDSEGARSMDSVSYNFCLWLVFSTSEVFSQSVAAEVSVRNLTLGRQT